MGTNFISIDEYGKNTERSESLLDVSDLRYNKDQVVIAKCEMCTAKLDANGNYFLRYRFSDKKGRLIAGRQYAVENIQESAKNISKMIGRLLIVTFTPDYFSGFYLRVKEVKILPANESALLIGKFFSKTIPNYEKEKELFDLVILPQLAASKLDSVFKECQLEYNLENSRYEGICDGLVGSSFKKINIFSGIVITAFDKATARDLVCTYSFIEAVMAKTKGDVRDTVKELTVLEPFLMGPAQKQFFDLIESTLYLKFGMSRDLYRSESLYLGRIEDFITNTLKDQSRIENTLGVFMEGDKLFERR